MEAGQEAGAAKANAMTADVVWAMFTDGMACSQIDEALELPPGTAHRHVTGRWISGMSHHEREKMRWMEDDD